MQWLHITAIVLVVLGAVATIIIGQSNSNKQTDSRYMKNTGRKWLRLSAIYVASVLVVVGILWFLN
ncbi:hypothetical protein [Paenibacillus daejeonensis]|uniref:hypothetical protein n=1 Tax=Paenibacillus daejeonensis TaxID=135193 RepID=UPI00039B7F8D|nr:hypothetical protein [Paenibacillus daejeonensis]